jgi:hypothetical protein
MVELNNLKKWKKKYFLDMNQHQGLKEKDNQQREIDRFIFYFQ